MTLTSLYRARAMDAIIDVAYRDAQAGLNPGVVRQDAMMRLRMAGFTFEEIGHHFDLTRTRVRQITEAGFKEDRWRRAYEFRLAAVRLQAAATGVLDGLRASGGPARPASGRCRGCGRRLKLLATDGTLPAHFVEVWEEESVWVREPRESSGSWVQRRCEGSRLPPAPPAGITHNVATPESLEWQ